MQYYQCFQPFFLCRMGLCTCYKCVHKGVVTHTFYAKTAIFLTLYPFVRVYFCTL